MLTGCLEWLGFNLHPSTKGKAMQGMSWLLFRAQLNVSLSQGIRSFYKTLSTIERRLTKDCVLSFGLLKGLVSTLLRSGSVD